MSNETTTFADPDATTSLTAPEGTYFDAKYTLGDGALLYLPGTNEFVALYPEEWLHFRQDADEHEQAIAAQQEANQRVTEAARVLRAAQLTGIRPQVQNAEDALAKALSDLAAANKKLKAKLEPLGDLKASGAKKLVESVVLHKSEKKYRPRYVNADKLKSALADKRVYMVNGPAEKAKRPQDKILNGFSVNTKEIKSRILERAQDKAKFKKEWKLAPEGETEYHGVLTQWAKVMNGDIAHFLERKTSDIEKHFNIDPTDPKRNVDLSAEAQLMRYTAGAGIEANFNPFQGNLFDKRDSGWAKTMKRGISQGKFGIKANAHADFAVAEGKVRTIWYWPHFAGWHCDPTVMEQPIDLGWWRFSADIVLSATAGASVCAELDVALLYTANKQGIKGTPKGERGMKTKTGANADLDVFAGAKAGVDLAGALQWLSPEGLTDGRARTAEKKTKTETAEYVDVAMIKPGVTAAAGVMGSLAFKCFYENGRFKITAKAGLCIGLGGKGTFTGDVGVETIGEFFKCIAYQLKHLDWHKFMELMHKDAYVAYCQILYVVVVEGKRLVDSVGKEFLLLTAEFDDAVDAARQRGKKFLDQVKKSLGHLFTYLPPETMGLILAQVAQIGAAESLREEAGSIVAVAMTTMQTPREKYEVLQRLTLNGGKVDVTSSTLILNAMLASTSHAGCLERTDIALASAQPVKGYPFLRNDEPEFVTARLGIDHPIYGIHSTVA